MAKKNDATPASEADDANVGRRNFLKSAALGGAAMAAAPLSAAQAANAKVSTKAAPGSVRNTSSLLPGVSQEQECAIPPASTASPVARAWGGDYMVDTLKHVGIEHIALIPGSTFKGFQESVVNYGMLNAPKFDLISVTHEEHAAGFCQGYQKVTGKPMACMVHATVGLQHASISIYEAFSDRVPMIVITAAHFAAEKRGTPVDWFHTVNDGPALTREFTKWDDTPGSLTHWGESMVRGWRFAMTPPYGPIVLAADQELQEMELPEDKVPPLPSFTPPSVAMGDANAVRAAAQMLVNAQNPLILVDMLARTPQGVKLLIELAETLQCGVIDMGGRMNFPWRHPLNMTQAVDFASSGADVLLGLELKDWSFQLRKYPANAKRININAAEIFMRASYQDFERYVGADIQISADGEATLPELIEAVKQLQKTSKSALKARGDRLAGFHRQALERSKEEAAVGWNDKLISVPRFHAELYDLIRDDKDWALSFASNAHPPRLWDAKEHWQWIGGNNGSGNTCVTACGAALGQKESGRYSITIGGDGDFMMCPGAIWTAAHHQLPLLYVVHNNHAWMQEQMWVQRVANRRNRGVDREGIGNTMTDPNMELAALAKSLGVYAEKVTEPGDLRGAFQRALAVVKKNEPALVDVWAQGR